MMKRGIAPLTVAAAAFALSTAAFAQSATQSQTPAQMTPAPKSSSTLSHADSSFLKDAAEAGLAEVQEGQLAESNAKDAQVKSFGEQMVTDHTKANDQLKALAQSKNVDVPTEPSMMQRASVKHLASAKDAAFDKRYASDAVSDHQKVVKLFQKEASQGHDPDVKAFAQQMLPALQHHLAMARDLQKTVSASNS